MPHLFRLGLLGLLALRPLVGQAQVARQYAAGSYVLRGDGGTQRLTGQLRLKRHKLLVVSADGKRHRLSPTQVSSFRLGSRSYAAVEDFLVRDKDVKAAFAEQLDSGQVTLFRYTHWWNTGADWLNLYRYPISLYLVGGPAAHLVEVNNTANFQRNARLVLRPRPDLLRLLEDGRITYDNFPAAVHALNHGELFQP